MEAERHGDSANNLIAGPLQTGDLCERSSEAQESLNLTRTHQVHPPLYQSQDLQRNLKFSQVRHPPSAGLQGRQHIPELA